MADLPLRRQVALAAELMDAMAPDWFEFIDTGTFNMGSSYDCIAGQTFGEDDIVRRPDPYNPFRVSPRPSGYGVLTASLSGEQEAAFGDAFASGESYWLREIADRMDAAA